LIRVRERARKSERANDKALCVRVESEGETVLDVLKRAPRSRQLQSVAWRWRGVPDCAQCVKHSKTRARYTRTTDCRTRPRHGAHRRMRTRLRPRSGRLPPSADAYAFVSAESPALHDKTMCDLCAERCRGWPSALRGPRWLLSLEVRARLPALFAASLSCHMFKTTTSLSFLLGWPAARASSLVA